MEQDLANELDQTHDRDGVDDESNHSSSSVECGDESNYSPGSIIEVEESTDDDEDSDDVFERKSRKQNHTDVNVRKSGRQTLHPGKRYYEDDDYEDEIPKRKKRKGKKKKPQKKVNVPGWEIQNMVQDDGTESDHFSYCDKCHGVGELLLCDDCPRAFHLKCAKLDEVPEGHWTCPRCLNEGEREPEPDFHENKCKVCREGGNVLMCDFCPLVFHLHCLNPKLEEAPTGIWKCPWCKVLAKPLKGRICAILTWRWDHQLEGQDEFDHTSSPDKRRALQRAMEAKSGKSLKQPQREFFVRYQNFSYWDCEWITQLQLEVFNPHRFKTFQMKWDQEVPPSCEDGSFVGSGTKTLEEDPHNLQSRYHRYGIKPEWLTIKRIIAHETVEEVHCYYVLWRGLGYDDATWEEARDILKNPALKDTFQDHVDRYWARRHRKRKPKKEAIKRAPKKSLLKKKLDKQPSCVDETGGILHPYQLEGLNWLRFSWSQGTNTILADEMGLGKTIQAIVFLNTLFQEGYLKGPFLISAPLSTVANWEREFEFWAPDLYVVTYTGLQNARANIRHHEFSYDENPFAFVNKPGRFKAGCQVKFDVLLTSYEFINTDYTTLQSIDWEVLIVDEAHRLKNQQSLYFRLLSQYNIGYRLLLTGTPLQNNVEELFNLLNFLQKEKFSDMEEFLSEFADISKDEQVLHLHEVLKSHMLRRLKIDVLKDLPHKKELIVLVELSAMQKKFYKHILTKNFDALNVRGAKNATSLMNIMMDLRKCCNHPYLFPTAQLDAPLNRNGCYDGAALVRACGKLKLLSAMLKKLKRDGHRVLVFSQMTRVLDLLEDFLTNEGYQYERIDGNVDGKSRQYAIDRFNDLQSDSSVFLLSTRAGGLGINLASADTVIIYDMDWNPHNDIQAFSRAHRIGQKNKVMIYRFVSRGTVEEKITHVAKKKMMLTELVIHSGLGSTEKQKSLTKSEISNILKFGAENLFKDRSKQVHYDDKAVEQLLDRSQASDDIAAEEAAKGVNDYLRSFRVASYNVPEGHEDEEEVEQVHMDDPDYWNKVVGGAHARHKEEVKEQEQLLIESLGKGKRMRRKINYAEEIYGKAAKKQNQAGNKLPVVPRKLSEEDKEYAPPSSSHEDDEEKLSLSLLKSSDNERAGQEDKPISSLSEIIQQPGTKDGSSTTDLIQEESTTVKVETKVYVGKDKNRENVYLWKAKQLLDRTENSIHLAVPCKSSDSSLYNMLKEEPLAAESQARCPTTLTVCGYESVGILKGNGKENDRIVLKPLFDKKADMKPANEKISQQREMKVDSEVQFPKKVENQQEQQRIALGTSVVCNTSSNIVD